MNRRPSFGIAALVVLLGSVVLANWLVDRYGTVPVGLGLVAPAAVYAAGLALLARDAVQRHLGNLAAVLAILAGASLSALISPKLALASGAAFLAGESVDMAVWTAIRTRPAWAVLASGVVGGIVDTVVFLKLAPQLIPGVDNLDLWRGQVWAKACVAAAGAIVLALLAARRRRQEDGTVYGAIQRDLGR